jgi:hypothetical protein
MVVQSVIRHYTHLVRYSTSFFKLRRRHMGWRVFLHFTPSVSQNNVDWRVVKYRSRVDVVSPLQDIRVGSTYHIFSAQDKSTFILVWFHCALINSLCIMKCFSHLQNTEIDI